jgi:hypothetical protein
MRLRPLASFVAVVLGTVSLAVTAGPARAEVDAAPPSIKSVSVAPLTVDTSASAQVMTMTVHVTDDVTGITGMMASGTVVFRSPSGRTQLSGYFNESRRSEGNAQDGTYTVTSTLPRYSEHGAWTLTSVSASDGAGRYTSLYGDQLANAGLAASFTQDGADDHTAPTITSVSSPDPVDTSASAQPVSFTVTATDDASGVSSGSVYFRSPSGRQQFYGWFGDQSRTGGTAQAGTYSVTATLPRYSEQGTWTLSSVNGTDLAGNSVYLSGSQLGALTASFEQLGISDQTAPTVSALSVSPAAVNPANSAQTVTAEIQITDDLSGFTGPAYGSLTFQGPNWQSAYGSFSEGRRTSGDARNGTYAVDVAVPRSAALGSWTLSSISVSDGAGNSLYLSGSQLAQSNISASFDVVDTVSVPSAPTAVTAAKGNGQATVSWAAPARDGGAAVTGYDVVASAGNTAVKTVTVPAPASSSPPMGPGPGYANISTTVTGLTNGTAYTFTVAATNNAGTGPASTPTLPVTPYDPASDKTPPTISSLALAPTAIDTSDAARTIKATIRVTDNLAGFSSGSINFRSPSGRQSAYASFSSWNKTSGTDLDGTYEATITVNRYAEPGTWKVDSVSLMDQAWNSGWMSGADFAATGQPNSFQQTGTVADLAAPAITDVTVSPVSVDTSASSQTVKVSAHLTDNLAGVSSASLNFKSPSGRQTAYGSLWTRTSGTTIDGTWEGTVTLNRFAEKGTWTLDTVSLTDLLSNNRSMTRTDLAAAGVNASFEQTGATDTTAPALADLSFTPTSVDTSQSSQTVKATLRVTDDLAGLSSYTSPYLSLRSPSGRQTAYSTMTTRVSGTDVNAVLETSITLPQGSEKGTWSVSSVSISDVVGNSRTVTATDLEAANLPTGFTQTGAGDTTAPAMTGLTFSTPSIDTSAGPASITIRAQLSDAGSGVPNPYGPSISFVSPSNRQYASAMLQRISGTAQEGTYEGTVTIPRYAERGTWTVSGLYASDQIGNSVSFSRDALVAAGMPSSFDQTGADDSTAPTITALTVAPQSVDTSAAPVQAAVRISVTDDLSGVNSTPWVQFTSPSGRTTAGYVPMMRVSGNDRSATYEGTLTLPRYAERGTWKVTSAGVADASNNRLELDAAGVHAAGLDVTLSQTGADDSTPPTLESFSIETASVDTSSASQNVRITARIKDDLIGVASYSTAVFRSASGGQIANGSFWNRTGGTDLDATYEGGVYLPRFAESGTWTLEKLTLRDFGGNAVEISGPDVAAAGFTTTFKQTGSPSDTSAPRVTGLTVSPGNVDASTASRTVKVQVRFTDDLSGFGYNSRVTVTSPSGATKLETSLNPAIWPMTPLLDGTVEATLTVPKGAEAGVWRISRLELSDGANNVTTFDAAGLAAAGLPNGFNQTNGLPGTPTGVTATAGNSAATVTWSAPTDNGTAAVTGYRVTTYAGGAVVKTDTLVGQATTAAIGGLTNGTAYTFTVAAINAVGRSAESPASAPVTPVTPITVPGAPTGVAATAGNASATVTWTAPASTGGAPITGYRVTVRSGGVVIKTVTVTTPAANVTVTGLTNNTAYTFTVAAINVAGTGAESAASTAVTPKPGNVKPDKPKGK